MDFLPLLPFFVSLVIGGIIHRRYLRRVEEAYARYGLAVPELSSLPEGTRRGGAWFLFHPLPGDPPELAEEKRLILREVNRKVLPVIVIGMALFFGTAVSLSLTGGRCGK